MVLFLLKFVVHTYIIGTIFDLFYGHGFLANGLIRGILNLLHIRLNTGNASFTAAVILLIAVTFLGLLKPVQRVFAFFMGCKEPVGEQAVRLDNIKRILAEASGENLSEFKLYVINSPEVNAFALGGNIMAVNTAALEVWNDEEIAGIMAHELGHLTLKHSAYGLISYTVEWVSDLIVRLYVIICNVILLIMGMFRQIRGLALLLMFFLKIQMWGLKFLIHLPLNLYTLFTSRKNEYEADHYACEIGLGAGLYQALSYFKAVEIENATTVSWRENLFSTHPETIKRMERIENYLKGIEM